MDSFRNGKKGFHENVQIFLIVAFSISLFILLLKPFELYKRVLKEFSISESFSLE